MALIAVGSAGCRASDGEPASSDTQVVLRVSATAGLGEFLPSANVAGSTAAALDLVAEPAIAHVDVVSRRGSELVLRRKPESPMSADEIVDKLLYRELDRLRLEGDDIVATFSGPTAAAYFEQGVGGLDVGPFFVVDDEARPIVLRAREPGAIDAIELHEVSKSEEWRMLLGRQLDVVPVADATQRATLAATPTLRVVDIPVKNHIALYLNVRNPRLAEPRVRRALAQALDRKALATVVCGSPECATSSEFPSDAGPLPAELSIMTIRSETMLVLAAETVASQLAEKGIATTVTVVTVDEIQGLGLRGDYDAIVTPLTRAPLRYQFFRSPGSGEPSFTGYASADYDAAVAAGDLDAAEAILGRDAPVVPLYELRQFAAVDANWCGDIEPSTSSWRWLADLRPCEPGETP